MTQHPSAYVYDAKSLRYRGANGQFVSAKRVRASVDQLADAESATLRQYAQDMMDGKINFAEWQIRSLATIKQLNVAMGLAANGGIDATSASDLGYIGSLVKKQYQYFRGLVKDIKTGKQQLDGTLLSRMGLYGQAGRGTFEETVRRANKQIGNSRERRNLGAADHCKGADGCVALAAMGWQPIGTLPAIGDTPCMSNCKCNFSYAA